MAEKIQALKPANPALKKDGTPRKPRTGRAEGSMIVTLSPSVTAAVREHVPAVRAETGIETLTEKQVLDRLLAQLLKALKPTPAPAV